MTLFEELEQAVQNLTVVQGILAGDLLNLPGIIAQTMSKMVRKGGMDLPEFAVELGLNEIEARHIADILVAKGYLVEEKNKGTGALHYRTYFARMRSHHLPPDL